MNREKIQLILGSDKFRYLVVGTLTTLVNLVSFRLFTKVFDWNVTFSNVLSIIIAILFAFVTNRRFVFRSTSTGAKAVGIELVKFVGGRLLTMAIEVGGVFLIHNVMHRSPMTAKLVTQVIVFILNYVISKFFVFRDSDFGKKQTADGGQE